MVWALKGAFSKKKEPLLPFDKVNILSGYRRFLLVGSPLDTVRMWGLHLCPEENQGAQRPATGTLGPRSYATESMSLGWSVDKVGMTLQMCEKSLCLNAFMFFVCSVPTMFHPLGPGRWTLPLQRDVLAGEEDKSQGSEKKRSCHKVWSGIAAGFQTSLLLSLPGSWALCPPHSHQ